MNAFDQASLTTARARPIDPDTAHAWFRPTFATAALFALIACALIYQPWQPGPIISADFAEFGPLLSRADGLVDGYQAITDHYRQFGRFNPVTFAAIAAEWRVFGWSAIGWQFARFILMFGNALIAAIVVRRFGASVEGSMFGAALFLFGPAVAESWLIPQLSEGYGMPLLLAATLLALDFHAVRRWQPRALACASLLCACVLTKETFVACVPFVLLAAVCRDSAGRWDRPQVSPRNVGLVLGTASAVALLALLPIMRSKLTGPAGNYASEYGIAAMTLNNLASTLARMALPGTSVSDPPSLILLLLVCLFIGKMWRDAPGRRRDLGWKLATVATLPLAYAFVYWPWPSENYWFYYAGPATLGAAILLGLALTSLTQTTRPMVRWGARVVALLIIAFGGRWSHRAAENFYAARDASVSLMRILATTPDSARLVVASDRRDDEMVDKVTRTAVVVRATILPKLSRDFATTTQIGCAQAPDAAARSGSQTILVLYAAECPGLRMSPYMPWRSVIEPVRYFSLSKLGLVVDTTRIDIFRAGQ